MRSITRDQGSSPKPTFLPCPFCGKPPHTGARQDESLWSHDIVAWHHVGCYDCDIQMCFEDLMELARRWNRRNGKSKSKSKKRESE